MSDGLPVTPLPVDAAEKAAEVRGDEEWFRNAVFYEVVLSSFADGNHDGIGDFEGLTNRLGYLRWFGVDAVWVLPFYPSPFADGGYDVADYTGVAPRYGTLGDFDRFIEESHRQGIKVIIDLVLNHTSSAHPWFEASRTDPTGPYGDYYVWSDANDRYAGTRIIFIDTEDSNWAWDEVRQQYYWHRFFSHQPDLNFENEAVQQELLNVVRFWCDRGVDGIRLDAIPYLFEEEGTNSENLPPTHRFIARIRQLLEDDYPGVMLVAEANQPPTEVVQYFGSDDAPECHLCFHFPLMPQIFKAFRVGKATGLIETWTKTPPPPADGIWGLFLRNHDELTLEMVTDEERAQMYEWYAPEPRMKANVGIRRRLAPLLDSDRALKELAHALLLSLPGAPFLYYGDEIGMGDDIHLPDRDGVRTPMQWDSSPGAGFSEAPLEKFHQPLITSKGYSPQEINVADQSTDPDSWLNCLRGLLVTRNSIQSLQDGFFEIVESDNPAILVFWRHGTWRSPGDNAPILCVFNFGHNQEEATVRLFDVADDAETRWVAGNASVTQDGEVWKVEAPARGYGWVEFG